MNKVILIGNLTRDPESGTTQSGIAYCRFTLAVNRRFQKDKEQQECDFFNCTAWRGLAESVAKYAGKGKKVGVTGSIQIRQYDGNDGTKRTAVDVQVDECEFLSPKDAAAPAAPATNNSHCDLGTLNPVDEELPF